MLVKALAALIFLLQHVRLARRLSTAGPGIVTIHRHIDHVDELIAARKGPGLAVTLDYVTSPMR